MPEEVVIGNRRVGGSHPTYVVAEMSANHQQDFDRAVEILHAAKQAGADAVKLQTYTADTLTIDCQGEPFIIGPGSPWEGRRLYELYQEAATPWEWQPKLKAIADQLELDLFSTPFDATAVEFLEQMEVPAYKIASFEIVDLALIRRVAETGKPLVMSTGMATRQDIGEAVETARQAGNEQLVLLKCTSAYPAPPEEMHLRAIPELARAFQTPVGLSDHTLGIAVPAAAVALGARLIEKHLTLSREDLGPDSSFSLEPDEFRQMVEAVRTVEQALGRAEFCVGERERPSRAFRRSLFVVQDMDAGDTFTEESVRSIRPGNGLAPKHLPAVLGRRAARQISRGTPLSWELVGQDDSQ